MRVELEALKKYEFCEVGDGSMFIYNDKLYLMCAPADIDDGFSPSNYAYCFDDEDFDVFDRHTLVTPVLNYRIKITVN